MFQVPLEERVVVVHAIQMYGFTLFLIFADFVPEKRIKSKVFIAVAVKHILCTFY